MGYMYINFLYKHTHADKNRSSILILTFFISLVTHWTFSYIQRKRFSACTPEKTTLIGEPEEKHRLLFSTFYQQAYLPVTPCKFVVTVVAVVAVVVAVALLLLLLLYNPSLFCVGSGYSQYKKRSNQPETVGFFIFIKNIMNIKMNALLVLSLLLFLLLFESFSHQC